MRMKDIAAAPTMSEQKALGQQSGAIHSESAQIYGDEGVPHDSDDEPMVYETPQDYATSARQDRDRLIAEGADPNSVILQSELHNHILRQEGESSADFAKRYAETMKGMIDRGVSILNDQCPGSGATKREFREFSQWFSEMSEEGQVHEVPEKWLKFEKPAKG
ncbi:hypothetical protein DTO282F9_2997 [Paecilomyces variotii]|nr:hypothetical protein DTO282F9_2997 [Paecilomyces variotii]